MVNRAQRFEANAPKGGVLVGERTYQATREYIEYGPQLTLQLKGVSEPVSGYVALKLRPRA